MSRVSPASAFCGRLRRRGFTLIELLAAIAIIGLLMALIAGAVGSVRESARRQKIRTDERAIVNAIKAYYSEYGHYPFQTQSDEDVTYKDGTDGSRLQGRIFTALFGNDDDANPRRLVFLDTRPKGGGTCPVSGCWLDPWQQHYLIALDENNDNTVEMQCDLIATSVVSETVLVATMNGRTPIFSWQD
jgi:prepilin-type N-terminal cleavage/methylation domain-containing protein